MIAKAAMAQEIKKAISRVNTHGYEGDEPLDGESIEQYLERMGVPVSPEDLALAKEAMSEYGLDSKIN